MRKRTGGFTLIELMITIAVIGILSAIAYPNYTEYVKKSHRTEAKRELLRLANLQEQLFVDSRKYTDNMKDLGLAADPFITESKRYSIDASVIGSTFKLTATAQDAQATNDSHCAKFHLTELGEKTATSTDCWE